MVGLAGYVINACNSMNKTLNNDFNETAPFLNALIYANISYLIKAIILFIITFVIIYSKFKGE